MNFVNLKVINLSVIFSVYIMSCMFSDNQSSEIIEYNDLIQKPIAVIVENRSNKEESKILYGEVKKEKEGYVFENNRKINMNKTTLCNYFVVSILTWYLMIIHIYIINSIIYPL